MSRSCEARARHRAGRHRAPERREVEVEVEILDRRELLQGRHHLHGYLGQHGRLHGCVRDAARSPVRGRSSGLLGLAERCAKADYRCGEEIEGAGLVEGKGADFGQWRGAPV